MGAWRQCRCLIGLFQQLVQHILDLVLLPAKRHEADVFEQVHVVLCVWVDWLAILNIDLLRNISETFAPTNAERTESKLHHCVYLFTSLQSQDSDWIC